MRFLRKHKTAFLALAVYHFVFFFPTLFMHRVPSPNDVFFNYNPWAAVHPTDVQNSLLNDPPTAYYTLMSLLRYDWRAFHWNPFVACGIPGFGSSAAAVLSPFVVIPTFLAPLWCVYTGIILLKLNVAFFFGYLWLREERLGKAAAAIGAIIIAAAGPVAVRWWWQITNPTALYPALLWMVCRAVHGKRIPVWLVAVISLTYALSGFPAAMAYGAWLCLAYAAFLLIREHSRPRFQAAIPAILGVAIALPSIVPMVQIIERTGYLPARANVAAQFAFPLDHFANFVDPDRLGNPAYHKWGGNYVEGTVYVGLIAIPLAIASIAARRARSRWFWLAALAVVLGCMFGVPLLSSAVARLPGIKYSPLTRLVLVLPTIAGYLAAAGSGWVIRSRRSLVAALLAILAASDLGVFAGRFYPYLEPSAATPPSTPIIAFLQSQPKPFRIAPFFDFLWPNSSELFRLEDIRSHFSSEAKYRRLLERIDPSSVLTHSTVIQFNSLHFDFTDPLVSMLGVRYFLEQNPIEIIKWTTYKYTTPGVKETGAIRVQPGTVLQRHIAIGPEPFYAIELPVNVEQAFDNSARLQVTVFRGATKVYSRAFLPADIAAVEKVYIPIHGYAQSADTLLLRVQPVGLRATLLKGVAPAGDAPMFYGRVAIPLIFDRQLPDGRLFLNLTEVPRFHAVTRLREMNEEQFLAAKGVDFAQEAILTAAGEGAGAPLERAGAPLSPAQVHLAEYAEDRQVIDVHATGDAFLASSEKLTPELRVSIDGRRVRPAEINLLFAGVRVPAGNHRVMFWRRIGGDWWWLSAMAAMAAIALSVIDVVRR